MNRCEYKIIQHSSPHILLSCDIESPLWPSVLVLGTYPWAVSCEVVIQDRNTNRNMLIAYRLSYLYISVLVVLWTVMKIMEMQLNMVHGWIRK
jgi:hypothetical protein